MEPLAQVPLVLVQLKLVPLELAPLALVPVPSPQSREEFCLPQRAHKNLLLHPFARETTRLQQPPALEQLLLPLLLS